MSKDDVLNGRTILSFANTVSKENLPRTINHGHVSGKIVYIQPNLPGDKVTVEICHILTRGSITYRHNHLGGSK